MVKVLGGVTLVKGGYFTDQAPGRAVGAAVGGTAVGALVGSTVGGTLVGSGALVGAVDAAAVGLAGMGVAAGVQAASTAPEVKIEACRKARRESFLSVMLFLLIVSVKIG